MNAVLFPDGCMLDVPLYFAIIQMQTLLCVCALNSFLVCDTTFCTSFRLTD